MCCRSANHRRSEIKSHASDMGRPRQTDARHCTCRDQLDNSDFDSVEVPTGFTFELNAWLLKVIVEKSCFRLSRQDSAA